VVTALEGLDAQGRWLWTLSAGDDEDAWLALLADSLIREGAPGQRMA
jgi:putative hemin transport protein